MELTGKEWTEYKKVLCEIKRIGLRKAIDHIAKHMNSTVSVLTHIIGTNTHKKERQAAINIKWDIENTMIDDWDNHIFNISLLDIENRDLNVKTCFIKGWDQKIFDNAYRFAMGAIEDNEYK